MKDLKLRIELAVSAVILDEAEFEGITKPSTEKQETIDRIVGNVVDELSGKINWD